MSLITDQDEHSDYILSIIGRDEKSAHAELLPKVESWLSPRVSQLCTIRRTSQVALARLAVSAANSEELVRELRLVRKEWLGSFDCDVNLCPAYLADWYNSPDQTGSALFVFDLDSTLIQMEVIDEIARLAGVHEKVSVKPVVPSESFRK